MPSVPGKRLFIIYISGWTKLCPLAVRMRASEQNSCSDIAEYLLSYVIFWRGTMKSIIDLADYVLSHYRSNVLLFAARVILNT